MYEVRGKTTKVRRLSYLFPNWQSLFFTREIYFRVISTRVLIVSNLIHRKGTSCIENVFLFFFFDVSTTQSLDRGSRPTRNLHHKSNLSIESDGERQERRHKKKQERERITRCSRVTTRKDDAPNKQTNNAESLKLKSIEYPRRLNREERTLHSTPLHFTFLKRTLR